MEFNSCQFHWNHLCDSFSISNSNRIESVIESPGMASTHMLEMKMVHFKWKPIVGITCTLLKFFAYSSESEFDFDSSQMVLIYYKHCFSVRILKQMFLLIKWCTQITSGNKKHVVWSIFVTKFSDKKDRLNRITVYTNLLIKTPNAHISFIYNWYFVKRQCKQQFRYYF